MHISPLCIGVSGHQNLGDEITQQFISDQFRQLLRNYQKSTNDLVLYSSLARGSDQLFVRIALELQIPVEAVLPCAEYEMIFPSLEDRNEYARLLFACRACYRLSAQECSDEA